jgi:hypothetical protein
MSSENGSGTTEKLKKDEPGKRQRSSIGFPYMDLNEAVGLARAIHNNVGTGMCSVEQLAPWVRQSPTSSGFRSRLGASRLFGIINTDRAEALHLTDLGRLVVDSKREREGRAKAFLSVPLYSAVHDKFKGGVLPPAAALEKELVALGVASTLTDTARRVLERSAEQAGFFESGRDRLVLPGFVPQEGSSVDTGDNSGGGSGAGTGGSGGDGGGLAELSLDPLLIALLKKIPDARKGWPAPNRLRWFRTFAMNVSQIYDADDDEPVEMKIELENKGAAN